MGFFDAILAKLALFSAYTGAGLASNWSACQPKEPKSLGKK